jgi:two-component system NarL family sensor kinase
MIRTLEKNQLESLMDAIPLMAWINKPDGGVTFYNRKWREYIGIMYENMMEWDWQIFHHPDDIERSLEKWTIALNSETDIEIELRLKCWNGIYKWHFLKAVPVRDSDDKIKFWFGTAIDIHEQKVAKEEMELQTKESQYELARVKDKLKIFSEESIQILEAIPHMAWINSPKGEKFYCNQRYLDYSGISLKGIKEFAWETILHPDDWQKAMDMRRKCFEDGSDFEMEYRYKRASDGMYRWHMGRAVPFKDGAGNIIKWIGIAIDIHEQKTGSDKIRQNEALLKEAQEIAHLGNWELDLSTYEIYWSDELCRIFGFNPGEIEHDFQTFLTFVHPNDLQKVLDFTNKIKVNRQPLQFNYRIIRPDGKVRIISASVKTITDGENKAIALRGVCHDITELKESQRFIQQISNASPGIIAVYDLDLKTTIYVNREINIVLGYSSEEKLEMGSFAYEKIVHPKDQSMFFEFLNSSLDFTDEETRELECRFKNAKGDWIWFGIRMKVFKRNVFGKVVQVIAIAQDVTYRKKLEEETIALKLSKQKEILNAILHAQEGERERIGEALHNGLGQLLYAIKLNLGNYNAKIGTDLKKDKLLLKEMDSLLLDAIDEAKKISFELMPGILKDFGLEIALKEQSKKLSKDFSVQWEINGLNERLGDYLEIAIFRIIQELMNNIVKHAKVNEANFELLMKDNIITISASDKGVGFDIQKVDYRGTGLQSIKNRVKLLNGTIDIVTKQGSGTLVTIVIDNNKYGE